MRNEFRQGGLSVSPFDSDDLLEVEFDNRKMRMSVEIDRHATEQLRDWLTEQIEELEKRYA